MDKLPGPDTPFLMRRPSRRLVYAFLALLPLGGCGASPSAVSGTDKSGQDSAGT